MIPKIDSAFKKKYGKRWFGEVIFLYGCIIFSALTVISVIALIASLIGLLPVSFGYFLISAIGSYILAVIFLCSSQVLIPTMPG